MLRDGIPEDAETIENIRVASWRAAYSEFMPAEYLNKLDTLKNVEGLQGRLSCQDLDFSIFVVEDNDAVVAFSIVGKPRYDAENNTIELWALNVSPNYWRKRIGQELTKKAIDVAREAGFKNIELWCIKGNSPAETTYEKAGFLPTGRERSSSHLTGNPIHERHYTRKL